MTIGELNAAVTAAILEAEGLERRGLKAEVAYRKVVECELALAAELAPESLEGRFARLGAVRAALKAGDAKLALIIVESQYNEAAGRTGSADPLDCFPDKGDALLEIP